MNDLPNRLLRLRFSFLIITTFIVMLQTLPIQTGFNQIFIPDILLVMTFSWVMQRPDIIGPILLTIALLFSDFILQRPPGLWTLIVLFSGMFLRMRSIRFKEEFFIYEWATVSVVIVFCYILQNVSMRFAFLAPYDFKLISIQALTAVLFYPICTWLFRPMLKARGVYNAQKKADRVAE